MDASHQVGSYMYAVLAKNGMFFWHLHLQGKQATHSLVLKNYSTCPPSTEKEQKLDETDTLNLKTQI